MRKISAHLILDGRGKCYSKGIVTIDEDGTILDIQDTGGMLEEAAGVEFYSGILVPGFINTHCHLELSHLKGAFPEGAGFISFLKMVVERRADDQAKIALAAETADLRMQKNGIVAVGDISNGTSAFEVKANSKINYFTFLETLGFTPARAEKAFEWAQSCAQIAGKVGLKSSIVPHAPYSVSAPLFQAIAIEALRSGLPISIHSQECREEDELYESGQGGMAAHLRDNLAVDTSFFLPTGRNALRSTLEFLPIVNHLLLVHNLFTEQEDLNYIRGVRPLDNTWFVLCPCSNLYIQNRLPDVELFRRNGLQLCLGTDSLASNHQLSMLAELKILQDAFPLVSLGELIRWATLNGSNALAISDKFGSLEVGKQPGINLLTGADLEHQKILPGTSVKKLC